jgi:beta-galactosidase
MLLGFLKLKPQEEALIASATARAAWVLWTDGYSTKVYSPGNGTTVPEAHLQWGARALNDLLQKANIHRYLQSGGDVLYAGRGWIAVHSAKGGDQLLQLPFKAKIIDSESGKVIEESDHLKIDIPLNSTLLFNIVLLSDISKNFGF